MPEDELSIDYIEFEGDIKSNKIKLDLDYKMDSTESFSISFV